MKIRSTPRALRRNANGSRSPVGPRPIPNIPASVSSRSAAARARPGAVRGDRIAREAWKVRFLDGVGDRVRLSGIARVARPHVPLEVRELADHRGHEVALAERGRAHRVARLLRVEPRRAGDVPHEGRDPVGLGRHRPELLLEHEPFEGRPIVTEGFLAIGAHEVRRVFEPWPDDPLVARAHCVRAAALDVADGDERAQQATVVVLDRGSSAGAPGGWP